MRVVIAIGLSNSTTLLNEGDLSDASNKRASEVDIPCSPPDSLLPILTSLKYFADSFGIKFHPNCFKLINSVSLVTFFL